MNPSITSKRELLRSFKDLPIEEKNKIQSLSNEIKTKDQHNSLQWMYVGDKIDPEEYLLGKRIDSGTGYAPDVPSEGGFTVDVANKIREDPLFIIKKRELEERKKLIENPIKFKQLQSYLQTENVSRRSCRLKQQSSSSSGTDSDYEHKRKHRRNRDRRVRDSSCEKKEKKAARERKHHHKERSSSSRKSHLKKELRRHETRRCDDSNDDKIYRSGRKDGIKNENRRKNSEGENVDKLDEMKKNAIWRKGISERNVKRFKKEAELEKMIHESSSVSDIIMPVLQNSYASVADNIKRNRRKLQKNTDGINTCFTNKH